ncbi:DNA-binding protein [Candidatus Kaiserbacteria bacterium]|nr:DNA-binding protein [Candidatus Kaiserbacteria bacterium]
MKSIKAGNKFVIKIEKGEEVLSSLLEFCLTNNIKNASISGLGAVEWVSCGYYSLSDKKYHFKQYDGMYEVLNMTGNVCLKEGKPFVHLHAIFSDTENHTFGGHVEEMRVGVVLELSIEILETNISRIYNEEIGLFLMDI